MIEWSLKRYMSLFLRFVKFLRFLETPKRDFLRFLLCCIRFPEQCYD